MILWNFYFRTSMFLMIFKQARRKWHQLPDDELLLIYKDERDLRVIGEFYSRYGHLVMGCALKYLKQIENAEDLTLSIFEHLADKIEKHSIQHFKSWLYQVTKNECLQVLRKNKPTSDIDSHFHLQTEEPELDEMQLKELKLEQLEQLLTELKPQQRECIELFYLQDLSYVEISERLNIPVNTVKSAIQNGKRNLFIKMEQHGK